MAYAVGSGVGKVISEKVARELGLPNLTWRTLALCTGEPPLDCDLGEGREEGEQVRLMGIPVPPGYQSGIFERLRSNQSANGLMSDVKKTIKHNYGHALPRFH